ncbi:MAG TPA: hypothetical protein VL832_09410 [Puia sp.]|nr:hypothetical protein [Puia sp.]
MKAISNITQSLISTLTSLQLTNRKMPELVPVRVVTNVYRDHLK